VMVCQDYRRLGIASLLMRILEGICNTYLKAYFISLYVRPTKAQAHALYGRLGRLLITTRRSTKTVWTCGSRCRATQTGTS
jgi:ribosomal protein S18 acetylase RimI-like enzyme